MVVHGDFRDSYAVDFIKFWVKLGNYKQTAQSWKSVPFNIYMLSAQKINIMGTS